MTGNLSRTVLGGAGARESACLPDLTKDVWSIHLENRKKPISSQSKEVGFFCSIARVLADASRRLE